MKDDGWLRFSGQVDGGEQGHAGRETLAQALVMTREMLSAAKGADWEQLSRLEEARAPLVRRQHPSDVVSRAQIEQILAYDLQLQALLGNAREAVARHMAAGAQAVFPDGERLWRRACPSPSGRRWREATDEGTGEARSRRIAGRASPAPSPPPLSRGERGF